MVNTGYELQAAAIIIGIRMTVAEIVQKEFAEVNS
jgi:hypothetical protein